MGAHSPQHTSCSFPVVPSGLYRSLNSRTTFLCCMPVGVTITVLSSRHPEHALPVKQAVVVVAMEDCSCWDDEDADALRKKSDNHVYWWGVYCNCDNNMYVIYTIWHHASELYIKYQIIFRLIFNLSHDMTNLSVKTTIIIIYMYIHKPHWKKYSISLVSVTQMMFFILFLVYSHVLISRCLSSWIILFE